MPLLERETELALIAAALAGAASGRGSVIVVSGQAGAGKSAVLAAAQERAIGLRALTARGGELERDLPLGLARQLLEPALSDLEPAAAAETREVVGPAADAILGRGSAGDGDPNVILHGLHVLVGHLAAERPLLLAADDVQWADAASLRFLAFLARRIPAMPAVLLVARRTGEPATDEAALEVIAGQPHAQVLVLAPLSVQATAELVTEIAGARADERFCRACHEASAGNPFVLRELVRALHERGVAFDAHGAARVLDAGPPAVARWVLARLARLPRAAGDLARAVAVLGQQADVGSAARLAGLSLNEAETALDSLVGGHLLSPGRPLDFIHPVVRSAVHDAMPPGSRSGAHRSAARLLRDQDAAPGAVAMHLLAAEPAGEPWVAEALLDAARVALGQGAPEVAASQVQRALAEPPPSHLRAPLLRELGNAERRLGLKTADERFLAALEATTDARERAETLLDMLIMGAADTSAIARIRSAMPAVAPVDAELALRLRARLLLALAEIAPQALGPELRAAERALAAGSGNTLGARLVAGMLANDAARRCLPRRNVLDHAFRAVGRDDDYTSDLQAGYPHIYALAALAISDELNMADKRYTEAAEFAQRRGSLVGAGIALFQRALFRLHAGALTAAADDARHALEKANRTSEGWLSAVAVATLAQVLIEQGQFDEAAAILEGRDPPSGNALAPDTLLLALARGTLWLAVGRPADAQAVFAAVGHTADASGVRHPLMLPWRSRAAQALVALGRSAEARTIASEALAIAEGADVPSAIGEARRVLALSAEDGPDISLLRDAVAALETAPAPIQLARALTDLGAALRRTGERQAAREPLSRALELATRHGAMPVAETAGTELRAAGARPRRVMRSGVDALTPSERRIAELAAAGMTNREIAAQLFITTKTAEHHLAAVYRKLDIRSRRELSTALQDS